jgi:glycosyltransferase involved in cell wall biosynthesis
MKISVITVSYNAAATIKKALDSVARQSYGDIEHIIVDGASGDGTVELIRQYGARASKFVSEPDAGIYHAMNKGLGLAAGDVIGFLNADDFYATEHVLAKVAQTFRDPAVEACYGDLCYVQREDVSTVVRYWKSSPFEERSFEKGWCPPHPTFFVRRQVYERLGGFDLSYRIAADVELMMRFLERGKIKAHYLPEVLVMMRMGGMTNRSIKNIIVQNREILRALRSHGLNTSLSKYWSHKIYSRTRQYLARPSMSLGDRGPGRQ